MSGGKPQDRAALQHDVLSVHAEDTVGFGCQEDPVIYLTVYYVIQ